MPGRGAAGEGGAEHERGAPSLSGTKLTIYGGSREIGGNQILLEEDHQRLLLDFGTNFARTQEYYDEFLPTRVHASLRDLLRLGVVPEIEGIYREDLFRPRGIEDAWEGLEHFYQAPVRSYEQYLAEEKRPAVAGVLVSHPHADHMQYVQFLDPRIPVVCLPVAKTVLQVIEEVSTRTSELVTYKGRRVTRTKSGMFPQSPSMEYEDPAPRRYLTPAPWAPFQLGAFDVTPIPVDHSVPGAASYLVRTPRGRTVFYTGDLRFHGRRGDLTKRLFELTRARGPDVLLCEGTRIDSDSRDNEEGVERSLKDIVGQTQGLCCVDFSWKDTDRFETMWRVAQAHHKKLVVSPELAYLLAKLSAAHPEQFKPLEEYADTSVYLRRMKSLLYSPADYSKKTDLGYFRDFDEFKDELKRLPDHPALAHFLHGTRASQIRAKPRDHLLSLTYFEMNDLFDLDPPPGSYYLRAACSPFNVEMEMDIHKQRRWMERFGFRHNLGDTSVCKGHAHPKGGLEGLAHVSGHASGAELKPFVQAMEPKVLVPIHTENPEAFEGWAKEVSFASKAWVPYVVEL